MSPDTWVAKHGIKNDLFNTFDQFQIKGSFCGPVGKVGLSDMQNARVMGFTQFTGKPGRPGNM